MRLYCATTNPGKLREFRLAAGRNASLDLVPLPNLNSYATPEETGATFEANAILKAEYYSRYADGPLIAEDSGLAVDLLDGRPGVFSARYAGPDATDSGNNAKLLADLAGRTSPARYVCVIALAERGRVTATFHGTVEGVILTEARGEGGFGYDPLFFYPPFGQSFGEASAEEKMRVSHRAEAAEKLFAFLAARDSS